MIAAVHNTVFELEAFGVLDFHTDFHVFVVFENILGAVDDVIVVGLIERNKPKFMFINQQKYLLPNQFHFRFDI